LRYEPLGLDGRAKVWENLLLRSNQGLDSLDVKVLAETELNGREFAQKEPFIVAMIYFLTLSFIWHRRDQECASSSHGSCC